MVPPKEPKKVHADSSDKPLGKYISRHPELHQIEKGKYLKDVVYGGLDGAVTTFAVVAGVAGASLSVGITLILGFANLLADGFSMAVGNYLGTKSEAEYHNRERKREEWEVEKYPEEEKEEIREIYRRKGFSGSLLEKVTKVITSDKKVWVDTMMVGELGILAEQKSGVKAGLATFLSFLVIGFIPLLAYVLDFIFPHLALNTFLVASILTGIALFVLGALRTYITGINWVRSGFEMLIIGGLASAVAYGVGYLLRSLV